MQDGIGQGTYGTTGAGHSGVALRVLESVDGLVALGAGLCFGRVADASRSGGAMCGKCTVLAGTESSAAAHLEVAPERVPLLDMEFWKQAGGEETWRRLHGRPTPVEELRLLRRCTYAGRPFGEEAFVGELEERFHRRWRRWGFELAVASARGK